MVFNAFRLEEHGSGVSDWVQIHDGGKSSSPNLTSQLSGATIPGNVISSGIEMFVHWKTGSDRQRREASTNNADYMEYKGFHMSVIQQGNKVHNISKREITVS